MPGNEDEQRGPEEQRDRHAYAIHDVARHSDGEFPRAGARVPGLRDGYFTIRTPLNGSQPLTAGVVCSPWT
jgi:hypothetical protein